MRRAALVYNPRAGRWRSGRHIIPIMEALRQARLTVDAMPTTGPGDATRLAREAALGGAEIVFAYGGDGTQREVAAGLLGTEAALAPLPGGTTNVVAQAFGIPSDPILAARALAELGSTRAIDVGLCGGEPFLMLASVGFDAHVVATISPLAKRFGGKLGVAWTVLRQIWRYPFPEYELRADGHPIGGTLIAVCNLPLYAGGWTLAPRARPDDRHLEVIVSRGPGRAAAFGFATDLIRGRHTERDDVTQITITEAVFEVPPGTPLQLDGDAYRGLLPARVAVAPAQLKLLTPR